MENMWQLAAFLRSLIGSDVSIATEYSRVSGTLIEVKYDYIVLRVGSSLVYIPLTSIKNVAY